MNEKALQLHASADAYRLLGVFLQLPTAEVAAGVADGLVADDLRAIAEELGCELPAEAMCGLRPAGAVDTQKLLVELRRDYTRLFTNPERPAVAVYESVFKQSDDFDTSALVFVSPTAIDAEHRYKQAGFAVDSAKHDSPDHMCAEVDFMCALRLREVEALEANDAEAAAAARRMAGDFCQAHLLKWGEGFFASVEEHAATPAYRAIGALGRVLVGAEAGSVGAGLADAAAATAAPVADVPVASVPAASIVAEEAEETTR